MKSVYQYILPLLVLVISANYVLSSDDSTELAAQTDSLPVASATEQAAVEWPEDLKPEVELTDFESIDREAAGDSEDENGLVDADYHEESADAIGKTQTDHYYTEPSDSDWQSSEWPSEETDAFVDAAQNVESNDRHAAAISTGKVNQQRSASQVVNITISGNEIITSQAGQTSHEVYGNDDVTGLSNSSVNTGNVTQNNTHDTNQLVFNDNQDLAGVDTTQERNCPNSLYMGGSAYEVSMLKKQGCPKPANYTGDW